MEPIFELQPKRLNQISVYRMLEGLLAGMSEKMLEKLCKKRLKPRSLLALLAYQKKQNKIKSKARKITLSSLQVKYFPSPSDSVAYIRKNYWGG